MNYKNKFSTMIIDDKIVDLNTISYDELNKLQNELEKKQEELRNDINAIINQEQGR